MQGVLLTMSALHLNRSGDLERRYFHVALTIMAFDGEDRQAQMRFGGNLVHTTVFEVDGTRLGNSARKDGGSLYFYRHSLLGVFVRSQPHLCWLLDIASRKARIVEQSLQRTRIYGDKVHGHYLRGWSEFGSSKTTPHWRRGEGSWWLAEGRRQRAMPLGLRRGRRAAHASLLL